MNLERLNELFSIVNEGYSSIQEREIRDYITNLQKENKKQKEVIDKAEKILNECKLLMSHEFDWEEQVDNVLYILKEVSE